MRVVQRDIKKVGRRLIASILVGFFALLITAAYTANAQAQSMGLFCLLKNDCQPPGSPTLSQPDANSYLQSNEFNFRWDGVTDDTAPVTYTICVDTTDAFLHAICADDLSVSEKNASDLLPDSDGVWYWRVAATDGASNVSDWSVARMVTIDTKNPVVSVSSDVLEVGGNRGSAHIIAAVTDDNVRDYQLTISSDALGIVKTINSADSLDFNWDATAPSRMAGGNYTVKIIGTDKSGRSAEASIGIVVDNDGPIVDVPDGGIISSGSISPAVTATDAHQANLTYIWVADDANPSTLNYQTTAKEPVFTPLVEGNYTYLLTATDDFGNSTTTSFSFDYKQLLETLPDPLVTTPSVDTTDSSGSGVAAAADATRQLVASSRSADTETGTEGTPNVLGTVAQKVISGDAPHDAAPLVATGQGWRIFGILWFWWVIVIAAAVSLSLWVKRVIQYRRVHAGNKVNS